MPSYSLDTIWLYPNEIATKFFGGLKSKTTNFIKIDDLEVITDCS